MGFTRLLRNLARDKDFGERVVPIIPDEARTFGMDSLFRELKIYASQGQKYEPVDHDMLLNTPKPATVKFLKKASLRLAVLRVSSPRARVMQLEACRWCRFTPSIRCSVFNVSET